MDYIDATNDVIIEKEKTYIPDCPYCGGATSVYWYKVDGKLCDKSGIDCIKCGKVISLRINDLSRSEMISLEIEEWRNKNK